MLVEINLLPQKQKKSLFIYLLAAVIAILVMIAVIVGYIYHGDKTSTLANIEKEIEFTIALREIEERKLEEEETLDGVDVLTAKINWITTQQFSLVLLLEHLVSLLPERGYFMNYQYSDQGTVSINVQFDSARDAANYLYELNGSQYIVEARLQNLNTHEINDPEIDDRFYYLPRYLASYTIVFDQLALKQAEREVE